MELDDYKDTWDEIGKKLEEKENFNPKILNKMSKSKFNTKLRKIAIPELIASIICFGTAIYIGFQFNLLNTVLFKFVGIISILLLIFLPTLSLFSVWQLYKSADVNEPYAEILKEFAVQKMNFCKLQKLNITLSYLLLAVLMILITKLFGKHTNDENAYFMIFGVCFGYIVLLFFSKWVFKKYNKTIQQTEDLLNELST